MKIKKYLIITLILCVIMPVVIIYKNNYSPAYAAGGTSSEILIERDSLRVLSKFNEKEKRGIASTTKILTALCVIKNSDLNKVVEISDEMVGIEGSSVYLLKGEKYTVEQLLFGLMLRSGNDAATALAISTSGSVSAFVKLMNDTARSLNALDSNFANPHGLDDDKHYSTAYDLAIITASAMKDPTFKTIVDSEYYSFEKIGTGEKVVWTNKNKLLKKDESFNGVKTGFTKKCGRCLVAAKEEGGMQLISVVLNVGPMFERCEDLLDQGFKDYLLYKILDSSSEYARFKTGKTVKSELCVSVRDDVYYPLTVSEYNGLDYKFVPNSVDFKKDKICGSVGKIDVYLQNRLIYSAESFIIIPH